MHPLPLLLAAALLSNAPAGTGLGPMPTVTHGASEASPTEIAFWNSIQGSNQLEDFEAYLRKYPSGAFSDLARLRIKRLSAPTALRPPGISSQAADGSQIVIGGVAPMTGEAATFGISARNGFNMAVDEWNLQGGIGGKTLRLVMADDKGDPAEGANVFSSLVMNEHAIAILGPVMSKVALAGAPVCQAAQVPMVAATATNPRVTQVGDFIFRACFIDLLQGTVGARFAFEQLKTRKAACLFDVGNDYTRGLSYSFSAKYAALGGKVVAFEGHATGTTDFRSQLAKILAAKPEILYVSDYYNDAALIARQARELGFKGPMVGGDGWDSPRLVEVAGKAIDGCFFTNHYAADDTHAMVQQFVRRYRIRFGSTPDAIAALGYDAANLLFDAIRRAGRLDGPSIREALAATDLSLITGQLKFDSERNPVKPAVVCEIKEGKVVYSATVNP